MTPLKSINIALIIPFRLGVPNTLNAKFPEYPSTDTILHRRDKRKHFLLVTRVRQTVIVMSPADDATSTPSENFRGFFDLPPAPALLPRTRRRKPRAPFPSNQIRLIKHISATKYSIRIERPLEFGHFIQISLAHHRREIFALQFADPVFRRNRPAKHYRLRDTTAVNVPCLFGFICILRQQVRVQMTVADMPKNDILDTARIKRLFVISQKRSKILIRNGHVSPDFSLPIPNNPLIHCNRQRVTECAHLFAILLICRKPRTLNIGAVFLEQGIPGFEQSIIVRGIRFLLKKYRTFRVRRRLGKFL